MARQPRIIYPGAYYHVLARGNQRQPIVRTDEDRSMFLSTLGEAVEKTHWQVLAFALMTNHYHLVICTPDPNLVEGMQWFQNTYTRRFSSRHRAWGHLFGGRYKAILVDPEDDRRQGAPTQYLSALLDYVHLNPVRATLLTSDSDLLAYPWSSLARGYGCPPKQRLPWLDVPAGLALSGLNDTAAHRKIFLHHLEERARLENRKTCGISSLSATQNLHSTLQRGWYWGRQTFGEALAKKLTKPRNRTYRSSSPVKKQERLSADAILSAGLAHFALQDQSWSRANHRPRAAIAWALARKTSIPQTWIADRLALRNAANVSQLIRRFERETHPHNPKIQSWMKNLKKLS